MRHERQESDAKRARTSSSEEGSLGSSSPFSITPPPTPAPEDLQKRQPASRILASTASTSRAAEKAAAMPAPVEPEPANPPVEKEEVTVEISKTAQDISEELLELFPFEEELISMDF